MRILKNPYLLILMILQVPILIEVDPLFTNPYTNGWAIVLGMILTSFIIPEKKRKPEQHPMPNYKVNFNGVFTSVSETDDKVDNEFVFSSLKKANSAKRKFLKKLRKTQRIFQKTHYPSRAIY